MKNQDLGYKIRDFEPCNTFIKSEDNEMKSGDEHSKEVLNKIEKELQAGETLMQFEEIDIKIEGDNWEG